MYKYFVSEGVPVQKSDDIVNMDLKSETKGGTRSMKKQAILERSGYRVERISAREWRYSPDACINRIKNILAEEN